MESEDRTLLVETLAGMRELAGEMREFKTRLVERVEKLEKRESEKGKEKLGIISVVIAFCALALNIVVNLYLRGGS